MLSRESIEAIARKYAGAYFSGLLFQDADSFARFADDLILTTSPVEQHEAAPAAELLNVHEVLSSGKGFWRTCSGCHESEDGSPGGRLPVQRDPPM
ncbi:MAG: hypothetical protein ACN6QT_00860 [Burkholderia contaminans]|uniref:Uncharacterized protein n=2 Tax=Bacteria TaxID=2 RepID=A0AAP4VMI3_9BURK|nr:MULTISPECIES: hypothetical protein [Burkholderia]MBD1417069.1 hypothetical protein [Burkholderia contaminans]MBH9667797.1 hypothetical protein [Burkholderia contaminans]MBH9675159.1 hypothetical protein [Burkholderia contaminans]MBH9704837.1 hypothetical protein [Burkholderia contaminans]MBH9724740.1 hypothetical protein [Burkholderia contaminans]